MEKTDLCDYWFEVHGSRGIRREISEIEYYITFTNILYILIFSIIFVLLLYNIT